MLARLRAFGCYFIRRLEERSTLGDLALAAGQAFVVPAPGSYIIMALLTAKAFVPDGTVRK